MVFTNTIVVGMLALAIGLVAAIFILEVEWNGSSIWFLNNLGKWMPSAILIGYRFRGECNSGDRGQATPRTFRKCESEGIYLSIRSLWKYCFQVFKVLHSFLESSEKNFGMKR